MPSVRRFLLPTVAIALFGALGCAQEREPINRVQANAMAKSFFVGDVGDPSDDPEFYWRNFVVDGSEAQELIGIGSWSGVDRVRWEITESTLFARRAYSQNDGADDKGRPDRPANGTLIAAYPIVKHFDIRRDYNPQTGEELNIVDENDTDRPWYERSHFRVDWSVNLIDTPQWSDMFQGRVFGDIELTPIAYYVNDANHPDAPHFVPEEGYFDITSRFLIEPATTPSPFSDLTGRVPACIALGIYTGAAVQNCDAQEAVIRSSYLRVDQVDPDGDFEPFENTRAHLDIMGNPGGLGDSFSVGIVTPPRLEWDPGYGYVDPGLTRYMHVHNIWEQSHQTLGTCSADADCRNLTGRSSATCLPSGTCSLACNYKASRDDDHNGTDDQCENADTGYDGSEGSQCSARNRCTIPYRDRTIKPVGYWMNPEMADELLDELDEKGNVTKRGANEDLIYTWDQAMRFSVAKTREVECRRTGGDRSDCHEEFFVPGSIEMVSFGGWGIEEPRSKDPVLFICHNPVRDYDHPQCGDPGYSARVGDLRHNFMFYWPYSSRVPWGGIANWNADPLTGQIIGASATTMGRSATYASALIRDVIMVANNELDIADITGGTSAELFQQRLRLGENRTALPVKELDNRVANIDQQHVAAQMHADFPKLTPSEAIKEYRALKLATRVDPTASSTAMLEFDALADRIRGSVFEAQIIDPNYLVDAAGLSPSTGITNAILDQVSPLRGRDFGQAEVLNQIVGQRFNARGVCFFNQIEGVGNPDIRGVAKYFADLYSNDHLVSDHGVRADASHQTFQTKRADLIYDHLFREIYKGIQLHEVGHSLGMLHNFASSYDSVNYNPQYWQLRTNEGAAMASCNGQPRSGETDTCLGPRYLDPETKDEQGYGSESRPGINYWGHTSTMEYQNERFFETVGLGQYDVLAMNMLYGRILQTFDGDDPDSLDRATQLDFASLNDSQISDENWVVWQTEAFGSGQQPMHYTELARRLKLYDPDRCREATKEEIAHAEWRIVHGKVCTHPPKDFAAWWDFADRTTDNSTVATKVAVADDAPSGAGNVRWPYRYGTSSNSYPHTNPSDAGADIYEVTMETIDKFEYSYPFNYYRRQRRDWYYPNIPSRTASDFYERVRAYHWGIAFSNAFLPQVFDGDQEILDAINNSDDWQRPYLLAETEMFKAIARAFLMPQIGSYARANETIQGTSKRAIYDVGSGTELFRIDASTGRYVDPSFDSSPIGGGSWDYQSWVRWAGFNVEKTDASRALTDGRSVFFTISRSNYLDGRNISVNFRSDMPHAVDRMIGGILSEDWETVAMHVDGGGTPEPKMLDLTADVPSRPDGALLLFPNVGYRQQVASLIWAHLFARVNADLTLSNKMRLWIEGTANAFDVPEAEQVRFTDPRSGFTYVARRYGPEEIDGKQVDRGIGSRMLLHANKLLSEAYRVAKDDDGSIVTDDFGRPELVLDADGHPIEIGDLSNTSDFHNYVGLLDASVQIGDLVGYGPFNNLPTRF